MLTIAPPAAETEFLYSTQREGARKGVERVFGVLFERFHILHRPSRICTVDDMEKEAVETCFILHNMACQE